MKKVALVAGTKRLAMAELTRVARAVQKQLDEHVRPVWKIEAQLRAFPKADRVPAGYWKATVRDKIEPEGAWSIHSYADGQPFAEITFGDDWTLGVSHDVIEMLVSPTANRYMDARSIRPGENHTVSYLVQVCDPCAATSYEIDGVKVADFSLPQFWAAAPGTAGRYSHTGALTKPREIVRGGYISWRDPRSRHYWQKVWWSEKPAYNDLGEYEGETPARRRRADPAPVVTQIPFVVPATRAIYRAQQPSVDRARQKVEDLIDEFGRRGARR